MFADLTDGQRAVMGLYYYEEMSVKEIAEALDIPESTVKGQLRGGRRKVETRVRALEEEGVKLWGLTPLAFFRAALQRDLSQSVPRTVPALGKTAAGEALRQTAKAVPTTQATAATAKIPARDLIVLCFFLQWSSFQRARRKRPQTASRHAGS
jgi:RNA polymerase sigma-70 factor (ECF subfamily)